MRTRRTRREEFLADTLKNILQLTGCAKPTHNHKIYMNRSESTQQANIQHRTISSIICIRDGLQNSICGCALCSFTRTKVDYSTIHWQIWSKVQTCRQTEMGFWFVATFHNTHTNTVHTTHTHTNPHCDPYLLIAFCYRRFKTLGLN